MTKAKTAKISTSKVAADSTLTYDLIKKAINILDVDLLYDLLEDLEPNDADNGQLKHILAKLPYILPNLSIEETSLLEEPALLEGNADLKSVQHQVQDQGGLTEQLDRVRKSLETRRDIAYALIDLSRDLAQNYDEMQGLIAEGLRAAAEANESILIDAFMHSGADLFYQLPERTTYDIIMSLDTSDSVTRAIDTLFPGFPQLARTNSPVHLIRHFINLWVYPPALETIPESNPVARTLISAQEETLKLIHAILANNIRKVIKILEKNSNVNVNARAVDSTSGPTILWYVIEKRNSDMASALVRHGARVDLPVKVDDITVPVLYSALVDPKVDERMMLALLQKSLFGSTADRSKFKELLYRMLFHGKNILEQAIECRLSLSCFSVLVEAAGAKVIADRNSRGKTVREVIEGDPNMSGYCELIDSYVVQCIQNPSDPDRRILALFGYDITSVNMQEPPVDDFYSLYGSYQRNIKELCECIDNNDLENFTRLTNYTGRGEFERLIVWEGREGSANPLPMLHRAVLFNRKEFVEKILDLKPVGHSIDSLLDHERRTALHYASALSDLTEIRNLLRAYGCSDHVKDRMGRTPLNFKMFMDKRCMRSIIGRLRFADFSTPEVNPWRRLERRSQLEDFAAHQLEDEDFSEFDDSSDEDGDFDDGDEFEDGPLLENGDAPQVLNSNRSFLRPERWSDFCSLM